MGRRCFILFCTVTQTVKEHQQKPVTQVTKKKIQESTPESPRKEDRARDTDGEFDVVCCRKFCVHHQNRKFPAAFAFLMMFFLFFHQFFRLMVVEIGGCGSVLFSYVLLVLFYGISKG
jgi:hypothetical protein